MCFPVIGDGMFVAAASSAAEKEGRKGERERGVPFCVHSLVYRRVMRRPSYHNGVIRLCVG